MHLSAVSKLPNKKHKSKPINITLVWPNDTETVDYHVDDEGKDDSNNYNVSESNDVNDYDSEYYWNDDNKSEDNYVKDDHRYIIQEYDNISIYYKE